MASIKTYTFYSLKDIFIQSMRFEDRWPSLWLACTIRSNLFLYSQWVSKKYDPLEKLYILFFQRNFYLVLYVLFAQSHPCPICALKAIYVQSMWLKVSLPSLSHICAISWKRFQPIQEVRIGWPSRIPIYSISSKAFLSSQRGSNLYGPR